ncbi:hypothetical protein AB0B27_21840, partial [Micromonospora rifamycinica]
MTGYLAALAALAVGTAPRLRPRGPGRFEPEPAEAGGFVTDEQEWTTPPPASRPVGPQATDRPPTPLPRVAVPPPPAPVGTPAAPTARKSVADPPPPVPPPGPRTHHGEGRDRPAAVAAPPTATRPPAPT